MRKGSFIRVKPTQFRPVRPPKRPERKTTPRRRPVAALGTLLGRAGLCDLEELGAATRFLAGHNVTLNGARVLPACRVVYEGDVLEADGRRIAVKGGGR
jgi:ribosome-associated protein YbcJ (S4-like RNA binding protein)